MTIYRADHCGSLLRPRYLRDALADRAYGKLSAEEMTAKEDRAILEALDMQKQAGLKIFSDGEFRRRFWLSAISEEFIDGMKNQGIDYIRYPFLKGKDVESPELFVPPNPVVVGKLGRKKRITADEIEFLRAHAPGTFKITVPSPVTLSRSQYREGVSDKVYPTWAEFFDDYARLMADEIADIVKDGVTYIQIDAPHYTRFIVPGRRAQLTDLGIDLEAELDRTLDAENRCLRAARGDGVTVALHICLGTYILGPQGPMGGAGDYDGAIIERIVNELEADVLLIEYSERAGEMATLRDTSEDKIVALGLVNTRDPRVETVDELVAKVETAARYHPVEKLSICPNCGFSGAAADSWVTEDIQKRKLETLVAAAEKVWPAG